MYISHQMQFTKSQLVTPFNQTIRYIYQVQISSSSHASPIQSAHEPWLLAMNIYNNNKLCASECNNKTINLYPNGGINYNLQLWNKMTYQCVTMFVQSEYPRERWIRSAEIERRKLSIFNSTSKPPRPDQIQLYVLALLVVMNRDTFFF